jgi:conjugal transfer mating pair stabilization protein TraG
LSDQIADDIARRVTSDQEFSARVAEGVKSDVGSGTRNVFTQGLRSEELSTLAEQASDTLSASRTHQHAESLARRYGMAGSFGAVQVGHALAQHPALTAELDAAILRMGLVGDHQRVASEWRYAETFADHAQARAAAGLGLLLGYEQPTYRSLDEEETLRAREAGLQILTSAFGGKSPVGIDPNRNAALEHEAPAFDSTGATVRGAGLSDPRPAADSLGPAVEAHQQMTQDRYDPTEVGRAHLRDKGRVEEFSSRLGEGLHADKREMYAARITERARLPRPTAQFIAQELGGLATQASQAPGMVARGTAGALTRFAETLLSSGSIPRAIDAAGGGWAQARGAMIDTRLAQVERIGLTPTQMAVYRGALNTVLPDVPAVQKAFDTEFSQAREALIRAEGPLGEPVADLLTRAASARDDTDLRLIAAYNRANRGHAPLSPPLSRIEATHRGGAGVLDLIAAAESGGNYDAFYGDANQSRVSLEGLTLGQVRALQRELVQTNGGSAIGRYQLIDDTLDRLAGSMGLAGKERFTPALQDRMALQLADEAGLQDWLKGNLTDDVFAHNLSRVWAGLPRGASNLSFHAGVSGNRAQLSYGEVLASLRAIRSAVRDDDS